jgi:hypothetical protein
LEFELDLELEPKLELALSLELSSLRTELRYIVTPTDFEEDYIPLIPEAISR